MLKAAGLQKGQGIFIAVKDCFSLLPWKIVTRRLSTWKEAEQLKDQMYIKVKWWYAEFRLWVKERSCLALLWEALGLCFVVGVTLWICKWHFEFRLHFWWDILIPLKKEKRSLAGIVGVKHEQPCSQPRCRSRWQGRERCLSLQLLIPSGPIPPTAALPRSVFPAPYLM